jgi:hypothetical protein
MPNFNLALNFFNGSRDPLENKRITISVIDGRGKFLGTQQTDTSTITLALPQTGDFITDQYTVNASTKSYRDAGYIGFRPGNNANGSLSLMLVERDARVVFRKPQDWPAAWAAVSNRIGTAFTDFAEKSNMSAACLLNLLEAIRLLPGGDQLLTDVAFHLPLTVATEQSRDKREAGILQDRALLFVDPRVKTAVDAMKGHELEDAPGSAHGKPKPGELSSSLKENRFPEANLQFTFFENAAAGKVYADIDMDYFRDKFSHGIFEFFPNTFFGSRTDPRKIYVLRWMASKNEQKPDFEPPYVLAV